MTDAQPKLYRVKSDTEDGKFYIVRYFAMTDKYVCECPAYKFSKRAPELISCKHIEKVKKYLDMKSKGEL
jgi:hypothetical protein